VPVNDLTNTWWTCMPQLIKFLREGTEFASKLNNFMEKFDKLRHTIVVLFMN